jgi:hypothetical protein
MSSPTLSCFISSASFSQPLDLSHPGAGLCAEGGSAPSPGEVGSRLRAVVAGPGCVEVEREKEDSDPGRFAAGLCRD